MFIYGLLTGLVIGVVLTIALLFIFAAARIASDRDTKVKKDADKSNKKIKEGKNE